MVLKGYKIKSPLPGSMILHPGKNIYNLLLLNYLTEKQKHKKTRRFSVMRWHAGSTVGTAEASGWWRGTCGEIYEMRWLAVSR